jgi:hypothetical protein
MVAPALPVTKLPHSVIYRGPLPYPSKNLFGSKVIESVKNNFKHCSNIKSVNVDGDKFYLMLPGERLRFDLIRYGVLKVDSNEGAE